MSHIRSHIMVCTGTGCTSSDSPKLITMDSGLITPQLRRAMRSWCL